MVRTQASALTMRNKVAMWQAAGSAGRLSVTDQGNTQGVALRYCAAEQIWTLMYARGQLRMVREVSGAKRD